MPCQNIRPLDHPPFILEQIKNLAHYIVKERTARNQTQAQWAQQLGIPEQTMVRIEHGDPEIAMATYLSCLWLLNPQLDLLSLLHTSPASVHSVQPINTQSSTPASVSAADEFAALLTSWKAPAINN